MIRFNKTDNKKPVEFNTGDYVQMEWGVDERRTAWALILSKRDEDGSSYMARALIVKDGRVLKRAYGKWLDEEAIVGRLETKEIVIAKLQGLSLDNPEVKNEDSEKWSGSSGE